MLEQVVESSGNDIRQVINVVQMWKNHQLDAGLLKNIMKDESVMITNFDAAKHVAVAGRSGSCDYSCRPTIYRDPALACTTPCIQLIDVVINGSIHLSTTHEDDGKFLLVLAM